MWQRRWEGREQKRLKRPRMYNVSDEIRTTLVVQVRNYGLRVAEAGRRVHTSVGKTTVS